MAYSNGPVTTKKERGNLGESIAARYLEQQGFFIRARNYANRMGEVDIIAEQKDLVVFVEVKARSANLFDMTELISPVKQKRIIAAAKSFIFEHKIYDKVCRFDVALIENLSQESVIYIPDAFVEPER